MITYSRFEGNLPVPLTRLLFDSNFVNMTDILREEEEEECRPARVCEVACCSLQ